MGCTLTPLATLVSLFLSMNEGHDRTRLMDQCKSSWSAWTCMALCLTHDMIQSHAYACVMQPRRDGILFLLALQVLARCILAYQLHSDSGRPRAIQHCAHARRCCVQCNNQGAVHSSSSQHAHKYNAVLIRRILCEPFVFATLNFARPS